MATRTDVLQIKLEQTGDGQVKASIAGVSNNLKQLDDQAKKTSDTAQFLKTSLIGLAGSLGAGVIIRNIVEYERLNKMLASVEGSAQAGAQAMEQIKQQARTAPYSIFQLTDAYIHLKSFGLDPMNGTLQAVIDQSSKLGGSQEQLEGIVLALGQAWAKQKLQGQEILQLINQGVPVWTLLSQALHKTTAELQDMSQKGQIGQEGIYKMIQQMGSSSAGAAISQMDTLGGKISNLGDAAAQFVAALGDAGLSAALKSAATLLTNLATEGQHAADVILPLIAGLASAKILGPILTNIGASALVMARNFEIASAAATILRGVLSFLGGPAGIIIGVATALSFFSSSSAKASTETDTLIQKIKSLTGQYRDLKREQLSQAITETTTQIKKLSAEISDIYNTAREISSAPLSKGEQAQIDARIKQIKELSTGLQQLKAQLANTKGGPSKPEFAYTPPQQDKAAQKLNDQLTAFRKSLLTQSQLIDQTQNDQLAKLQEFFDKGKIGYREYFDSIEVIERQAAQQRQQIEDQTNQLIYESRANVWQQVAALARTFAGNSRTAALIALGIEKALAISQVLIQGQVAAAKARAALIVPGNPASVAFAETQAQRILFASRLSAALVAAQGLAQAAQVGSGGASPGSAANPVYTQSVSNTTNQQNNPNAQQQIVLNFYGDTYGLPDFNNKVQQAAQELVRRDAVVVSTNSRNALDIRSG